jgi:hypothetical protein
MSAPVLLLLFIAALVDHSYTLAFVLFWMTVFRALTS